MAVDRLTGCSAIIVPRRIALATRTQCLSMPVPFLGLRVNILFLSTMVGIVPTEPSTRGTGPLTRALLHSKSALRESGPIVKTGRGNPAGPAVKREAEGGGRRRVPAHRSETRRGRLTHIKSEGNENGASAFE